MKGEYRMSNYEYGDTLYGTVTNCTMNGCFVRIDNAQPGEPNAYFRGYGQRNDRVMLSVIRSFPDQILTRLDSVREYAA